MRTLPRPSLLLRVAALVLTAGLAVSGCGGGTSSAPAADPGSTPPTSGTPSSAGDPGSTHGTDPKSGGKLVQLDKYGVSYRVPAGWTSIDGKQLLKPDNPVLKEVAGRMGVSVDQLLSTIGSNLQAYAITDQGAVNGFLDNVDGGGYPIGGLTEAQLEVQLAAIGAKPGKVVHSHTAAGELMRLPYVWTTNGVTIHGVALVIDLGDATAQVTVSAHDEQTATSIADEVQGSLQRMS
jgi:hypothetical protein